MIIISGVASTILTTEHPTIIEGYTSSNTDLCTVADVRKFTTIPDSISNSKINSYIPDSTSLVLLDSEDNTLTSSNMYAKLACCFRVVMFLEKEPGVNSGNRRLTSFSDGDFSGAFEQIQNDDELPPTNSGKYQYFLNKIAENPFCYVTVDPVIPDSDADYSEFDKINGVVRWDS